MQILPYVYKIIHKNSGEFYYGMRSANKVPSGEDLGVHYFTSNTKIQNNFSEYTFSVLAEFFIWEHAFLYENDLIQKHWDNPLLINKHFQKNPSSFSMQGFPRPDVVAMNKQTKRKPKESRKYKCSNCKKEVNKIEFVHHEPNEHYYCDVKCRNQFTAKNKVMSEQTKRKIGEATKARTPWNKGKKCSKDTKNKISETLKGRKHTENTKRKMSEKRKLRKIGPHTEEHKKKISESCKGRIPWNKGKTNPRPETKKSCNDDSLT